MAKPISKHFTWKEALYLPQWSREATDEDGLTAIHRANLVVLFSKMDQIRDHFKKSIIVHVAYRPSKYNEQVKGAKKSAHLEGMAVDFHVSGLDSDDVRKEIIDHKLLESLGLRMENLPNTNWVHIDTRAVPEGGNRYFVP
jgi:uncharacterized protein YcbK (DUF882 family)